MHATAHSTPKRRENVLVPCRKDEWADEDVAIT